jgi:hypothetical protein
VQRGDAEHSGTFLECEPAKVLQLHQFGLLGVFGRQERQGLIEGLDVVVRRDTGELVRFELDALTATAPPGGVAGAGVIDEDPPHRRGRGSQEVRPVLPLHPRVGELQPGLVEQEVCRLLRIG